MLMKKTFPMSLNINVGYVNLSLRYIFICHITKRKLFYYNKTNKLISKNWPSIYNLKWNTNLNQKLD